MWTPWLGASRIPLQCCAGDQCALFGPLCDSREYSAAHDRRARLMSRGAADAVMRFDCVDAARVDERLTGRRINSG